MNKIFCVGFQKTGTTTMREALRRLGFSVGAPPKKVNRTVNWSRPDPRGEIWKAVRSVVDANDGVQDSPCPFFYEEFDNQYPGSKFILTERDPEAWLKSYKKFFPDKNNRLRQWMYGVDQISGNENRYLEIYTGQNNKIKDYFAGREQDFITMDLSAGDGWAKLVPFLGSDLAGRFPHKNRNPG